MRVSTVIGAYVSNAGVSCGTNRITAYNRIETDKIKEYDMAQKIQTLFIDDIDGGDAAGTVRFALDGVEYEIDLSIEHTDELHSAIGKYIDHARKATGTRRAVRNAGRRNASAIDTQEVRAWAKARGIEIKERGRVPANVVEQYRTATGQ